MSNGQPNPKPGTRKVTVGALGGAAGTIVVWFLTGVMKQPIPVELAGAIGTLVSAFSVYFTKETFTT